jgi:predicted ATPase
VGEPAQLFQALYGLWAFYEVAGPLPTSLEIGDELLRFAQSVQSPAFQLRAHRALGGTLFWLGELLPAHTHLEQALALYNPQQHRGQAFQSGHDAGVACYSHVARTLWPLGYTALRLWRGTTKPSRWPNSKHMPPA